MVGIVFEKKKTISNVFITAVILNNMTFSYCQSYIIQ